MGSLSVNLCGIELDNPVIPASGTFGYGYEFAELYDINCLGTFSFKGTTKEPRFGNPTPRIAECTGGMINAVGLQNPGVDKVISEELPKLKACFHKPVMANVSGFSVADYAYTCERLDEEEQVGWLEVNVSCPNVHGGGMSFGTCPEAAAEVTAAVKKVTKKPVIVKLSPNVTDIVSIARACEDAGADGISLINTLLGMRIDLRTRKPIIANKMGGFSGPAIFPVALRMVYQVAGAVKIPVVGMGGVSSAEDVVEMMLAGASAVEVGAANLVNPYACRDIIRELPAVMEKYKIENLKDIIGGGEIMGKDVIVACDFSSAEATFAFLDKFTGRKPFVKIGMELYYAEGPAIVREIKARGHKIFLDLKLHDIPNTVKKAMSVLRNLDVDITNLHAAGTTAMMKAALEGLTREDGTRPLLIAVTQLTSTDQAAMESDLLIHEPIDEVVMHYAETAKNAGLDGVVCSPLEAGKVHERCGQRFLTVTPGVRFADGDVGDQKRVMTPAAAKAIGSDYIVVGRPITAAADPVAAYERCVAEFCD